MITPLLKLSAIACLVISSSLIGSSVTAESKLKESASLGQVPEARTSTEIIIEKGISDASAQPLPNPNFTTESELSISRPRGEEFELETRDDRWQYGNTGDLDRGTVKLKIH